MDFHGFLIEGALSKALSILIAVSLHRVVIQVYCQSIPLAIKFQISLSSSRHTKMFCSSASRLSNRQTAGSARQTKVRSSFNAEISPRTLPPNVQMAKDALLQEIQYTGRGASVSTQQRGAIEEAILTLETFSGDAVDFNQLPGAWKLEYTTAPDVVGILDAQRLPFIQVGDIFQTFTSTDQAVCKNVINLSVLPFLTERDGVRLTVTTRYDVTTPKRIALTFEKAKVSDVRISPILESLLAPALLPRGFPNMWLLQALREASVEVPLTTPSQLVANTPVRGGEYLLSYCDEDVLIGRAFQGTFVFTRSTLDL